MAVCWRALAAGCVCACVPPHQRGVWCAARRHVPAARCTRPSTWRPLPAHIPPPACRHLHFRSPPGLHQGGVWRGPSRGAWARDLRACPHQVRGRGGGVVGRVGGWGGGLRGGGVDARGGMKQSREGGQPSGMGCADPPACCLSHPPASHPLAHPLTLAPVFRPWNLPAAATRCAARSRRPRTWRRCTTRPT